MPCVLGMEKSTKGKVWIFLTYKYLEISYVKAYRTIQSIV